MQDVLARQNTPVSTRLSGTRTVSEEGETRGAGLASLLAFLWHQGLVEPVCDLGNLMMANC